VGKEDEREVKGSEMGGRPIKNDSVDSGGTEEPQMTGFVPG
jgi:hypothetical protein